MTIEKLPFCTPIFSFTNSTSRTLDTSCSLRLFVETYFCWSDKGAVPVNDREVQLFDLPAYQSSLGAFCAYLLTGLSYLTVIIPLIVLIAKAILRCGTDYTILPTIQPPASQTPATPSRVNRQVESRSGGNVPTRSTNQEDLSDLNPVNTIEDGETSEEISENADFEDEENSGVSVDLSKYYLEKENTIPFDFIARWFQDATNGVKDLEEDIRDTISLFAPAVLWDSLVKCTQLYLSDSEYGDDPTFKLIYTTIIDTLNNKRSLNDPSLNSMQRILKDYPELFLEPPLEIIKTQLRLYKKYFGTDSQASRMGINTYFPASMTDEHIPH
jgi:hypothetical protein